MDQNTSKLRIAQTLLAVSALGAVGAAISSLLSFSDASNSIKVVEAWRLIGYITFAALFVTLAIRPSISSIVWWIIIVNKLALAIAGWVLLAQPQNIPGASDLLVFDGMVTVLLVAAYFLSRKATAVPTEDLKKIEQ